MPARGWGEGGWTEGWMDGWAEECGMGGGGPGARSSGLEAEQLDSCLLPSGTGRCLASVSTDTSSPLSRAALPPSIFPPQRLQWLAESTARRGRKRRRSSSRDDKRGLGRESQSHRRPDCSYWKWHSPATGLAPSRDAQASGGALCASSAATPQSRSGRARAAPRGRKCWALLGSGACAPPQAGGPPGGLGLGCPSGVLGSTGTVLVTGTATAARRRASMGEPARRGRTQAGCMAEGGVLLDDKGPSGRRRWMGAGRINGRGMLRKSSGPAGWRPLLAREVVASAACSSACLLLLAACRHVQPASPMSCASLSPE
ncbi:hypothetical protein DFH27DRAFT_607589 [Peziza echinospora]|nr:hypothetical protein DFH27DRAFT_607589 [Peziza echinospora]